MSIYYNPNVESVYMSYSNDIEIKDEFEEIRNEIIHLIENEAVCKRKNVIFNVEQDDCFGYKEVNTIKLIAWALSKVDKKLVLLCNKNVKAELEKTSISLIPNLLIGKNW